MSFGQLVIGPPGCGKTTYCHGISQFYTAIERDHAIINLDPANDGIPYKPDIDISDLITLSDVMEEFSLGPNGGLIYCLEYLETNLDWLLEQLVKLKGKYLIFDLPGQVELFTNHMSLRNIILKLQSLDYRLCVIHLLDSHYCVDPSKYLSMLMVSLKSMLLLESPHVNVLSKIDLIESYGELEYYTQVQDLSFILDRLNQDTFTKKYQKLNASLCELVEDFGLVGFSTLCIQDKDSVLNLVRIIDKANGYIYGGLEEGNESIFQVAERWDIWDQYTKEVAEKYMKRPEDIDGDLDMDDIQEMYPGIGGLVNETILEHEVEN
ncbi:hypothetical protein HDV02_000984 [Globomyces sp. JEL0801]|nr:hypothetical protein HDV02_000984 [Globomyces sp. JEL0801]